MGCGSSRGDPSRATSLKDAVRGLRDNTVKTINIQSKIIGDPEAITLAGAFKGNTSLQSIILAGNMIGDDGAKALAGAFKGNTSLQTIRLQRNNIGVDGAKALADAFKDNTSLKEIDLECNNIGDDGAKALAGAFKDNTSLQTIYLYGNNIGDDGAKALADAFKDRGDGLQTISLGDNKIGDPGAKALLDAVKGNTSLQRIALYGNNKISADLLADVQAVADFNIERAEKSYEINAQAEKVLSGSASPEEVLAAIPQTFHYGFFEKTIALLQKGGWREALLAKAEAEFAKHEVGKHPLAKYIMPLAAFLQDAYSEHARIQLSADRNAEVLAQLAVELDAVVNQIGLDYGWKLVKALGKSGTAKLQQRLAQLDSGSDDVALYRGTTSKYRAADGNASYEQQGDERAAAVKAAHPGPQRQPTKSLLRLLVYATADEAQFKAEVQKLGESCGADVKLATIKGSSLKGILRLMEKGILKAIINGWDAVDFSDIRDVLRAMLVCGNNGTSFADDTAIAVKAQAAVYGSEVLSARRYKTRLTGDSVTEWRDELVNPLLTSGKHRLLVEIQIVRSKMLVQRETMGGHDGYDESRGLRGLYDACVASGLGASSSGDAGGQLSKKDQKKLGALIAKRDATIAKCDAAVKKLNLQIEALESGSTTASGEIVVFDAGEDEPVQAGAVNQKSACCVIV